MLYAYMQNDCAGRHWLKYGLRWPVGNIGEGMNILISMLARVGAVRSPGWSPRDSQAIMQENR